jgi:hypothetical protein
MQVIARSFLPSAPRFIARSRQLTPNSKKSANGNSRIERAIAAPPSLEKAPPNFGSAERKENSEVHLSLLQSDDERLGLPSGSTFYRLTKCPASHRLSQKARLLGQVAHETSPESEGGLAIHKAYEMQSAEGLSDIEAVDYEAIFAQREEITAEWLSNRQPVRQIAEERLWLHRGLRPVLSGKLDELLIQGERALLFDIKTGRGEVDPPANNVQLRVYAALARVRWPGLESVTVVILSPVRRYDVHKYSGAELDAIRDEILHTLATLDLESAPRIGEHCRYCPASLICPSRREETQALAVVAEELPTGSDASRLLETVVRVEAVCSQIRDYYKAQLENDPACVPGWRLQSSTRRWIPNPQQAFERLIEQFSVSEFLDSCSVKLADLEVAWARKNNVPTAQVRAQFDRYMQGVVFGKRTAPSLKQTSN